MLYVLSVILNTKEMTYILWSEWFSHPLMNSATGLFFILLVIHVWVGMRDIVIDYMPNDSIRLFTLTCIGFFLMMSSLEMLRILFSLAIKI